MDENKTKQSRSLPGKIDIYVIGDDGSISVGVGCKPDVFIEDVAIGKLFDRDTALHVKRNYGSTVGVMRDSDFRAVPKEYKTRKMILGRVDLP